MQSDHTFGGYQVSGDSNQTKPSEVALMILVGVPVLGILMGGVYSLPAMHFTKGRDPWLTRLLAVGLAITVFGIGLPFQTPLLYSGLLYLVSIGLLLLKRAMDGNLGSNLERFGLVHAVVFMLAWLLAVFPRILAKLADHQEPS